VTRYWFGAVTMCTLGANLGIVSQSYFLYSFRAIKDDFEIYRLLSPFCYAGQFSMSCAITL